MWSNSKTFAKYHLKVGKIKDHLLEYIFHATRQHRCNKLEYMIQGHREAEQSI